VKQQRSSYSPKAGSVLGKNRLEAFSDGVFAVAITLLVLNIQSPALLQDVVHTGSLQELARFAPKFLAFVLSFVIVGVYWVAHHNTFHYIKHSDRNLLWLNILLLMCIAFIPVPTALLGQYPAYQFPVILYGSTLVVTGIVLQTLWWYATGSYRLVDKDIDPHLVAHATRRNLTAPLLYLLAIGISFITIWISLGIFILVPAIYILPGRIDHYWLEMREMYEQRKMHEVEKGDHDNHGDASDKEGHARVHTGKLVSGRVFYQQQITALETLDLNRLLTQYHPDATIVGFDFIVKGHTEIRQHFENYFEHLGQLKLKATEKFTETEDAIFFEATIVSNLSEAKVYNVFLLWNGKATHHFTGIISHQSRDIP
jgi:uncharacterized membrane protein